MVLDRGEGLVSASRDKGLGTTDLRDTWLTLQENFSCAFDPSVSTAGETGQKPSTDLEIL